MLRLGCVLAVLGMTGWLVLHYPDLPARIPVHFDLGGEPDRFGPRSSALDQHPGRTGASDPVAMALNPGATTP